jgi:hypothetical protein
MGPPVTQCTVNATVPLAGWDPPACRVSPAKEPSVLVMASHWAHVGPCGYGMLVVSLWYPTLRGGREEGRELLRTKDCDPQGWVGPEWAWSQLFFYFYFFFIHM